MNVAPLLPLPIVAPLVGAIAAPLTSRIHRRMPLVVGIAAMSVSAAFMCLIALTTYAGSGHVASEYLSNERPFGGRSLGIALAADPFGITFGMLTAGLGLLLLISALSELGELGPRELGGLAGLALLLLAALIASALAADTINLFVWFEVAGLSSFGLTGFFLEQPTALEAAFKVCVLTTIAGFLVFIGSAMLYATDGALNLGHLHAALPERLRPVELVALALLVAGFATKAGLVPFHGWLPDAHAMVPGAVSAMFSALMVDLGIVALARLGLLVFAGSAPPLLTVLTWLGMSSALLGALMALAQDSLKRLLAWDTVSQTGILTVGFASANDHGVTGAVYHLINHGLFKALLFLCAGAVLHATGVAELSQMGGLLRQKPLTTLAFTVGALAIGGVPPLNGYISLDLIHEGLHEHPVLHALALIAQVLTVAALGRAAYLGFYRKRAKAYEQMERERPGMAFSLLTLCAGCAGFGLFPTRIVQDVAAPAASLLLHPQLYATGVLTGRAAVPRSEVAVSNLDPTVLLTSGAELLLGVLVAVLYIRRPEPALIRRLRAIHTGSVNDYATFLAIGAVVVAGVLLIG